jgi:UDP-N-acetylmuramate dehydrogenase
MDWLKDFAGRIETDAPLSRLTWFRLGGPARCLFHPHDVDALAGALRRGREECVPVNVLGCGANILVRDDGFDGVVVRLDEPAFREVFVEGESVRAGGGVDMMPLSRGLSAKGLSGLEPMAGIPSSIGGAVRMNAGGRYGEIADVVEKVAVMNRDGSVQEWSREQAGFGYRRSAVGDRVVLWAQFKLKEDDPRQVSRAYDEIFDQKMETQPLQDASAGCIFKNPPDASAGALIDKAGLKGATCGGASVSQRHANFIITRQGATASDVLRLIDLIRERVSERWGTELETEIEIW